MITKKYKTGNNIMCFKNNTVASSFDYKIIYEYNNYTNKIDIKIISKYLDKLEVIKMKSNWPCIYFIHNVQQNKEPVNKKIKPYIRNQLKKVYHEKII